MLAQLRQRRRQRRSPIVIGLTGSIAMGKTTVSAMAQRLRIPVFDSDAVSRSATANGGPALGALSREFPGLVANGTLDRVKLGQTVFSDEKKLRVLESIIHPIVRRERKNFLLKATRGRRKTVVLDIPLLFEVGAQRECDVVFVVTAPAFLQRQRVLARPGMTESKLDDILRRQMPSARKCAAADFTLFSGQGRAVTFRQLRRALKAVI